MTEHRDETIEELFDRGLEVRRAVLGAEYVDNSLKSANDFMMAFQNMTTEWCWGYAWTRSVAATSWASKSTSRDPV